MPLPFLLHLTRYTTMVLAFVGIGAFVALGLLVWLSRSGRTRSDGTWRRLADGVALLTNPGAALVVVGQTALLWVC